MENPSFWDPAVTEQALFLSPAHLSTLLLCLMFLGWLFSHRDKSYMKTYVRWGLMFLLLGSEISILFWAILTGTWDLRTHLPLQLCTISLFLCVWMLLTKHRTTFEIVYFFGIGGATQALVTPELFYSFPHFRFFHFFIAHLAIILAILYMVWVERFIVTIKSLIKSFVVLNVIALYVFIMNQLLGTNYMFLARKPTTPTIVDYLGPYPWYILSLEAVVLIIYFLLYLPFWKKDSHLKMEK
ncbi:TIGR02206 family membrane protein [Halalkalibacter urbisdiaboli]|uniref:YwaF family protein n=1 Tax=Halalkalibacter urbisdiaboli TaxID=1960589 RepID=UPI000B4535F1|nr:TIGR02206 family membrane protein [Halalkalibacter urbisdiaboli]